MKAIIIEDETTAVNSLKAILAQNTVTPIEVIAELESIEESVEFFRTSPHPDIIFMDIEMPQQGGMATAERILGVQDIRAGGDRCPGSLHYRLR